MSSTLYARGTLLQTGVRERAERTEQNIRELFQQLEETRRDIAGLKKENDALKQRLTHVYAVTGIPNVPLTGSGTA
jgi:hypothetical protein